VISCVSLWLPSQDQAVPEGDGTGSEAETKEKDERKDKQRKVDEGAKAWKVVQKEGR
jgi:hypothetical protein